MEYPELENLRQEIDAFKAWAATLPEHKAEWEVPYFDKSGNYKWDDIYEAVEQFIEKVPLEEWISEIYDLLLYILARDNEDEVILHFLENYPQHLITLASKALTYEDYDAKWQLAYGLSHLKDFKSTAEALLQEFIKDEHEYVRRRALLALEDLQSN
jgi:hypothetical protein